VLIDANLLIYAADSGASHHVAANAWLRRVLNGDERVGLPWTSIGAFMRVLTNPRSTRNPISPATAWDTMTKWLAADVAWVPVASGRTAGPFGELVVRHQLTANLIPDAQLAALAIEHGQVVMSADSDFARFPEIRWVNPLLPKR
jgi:hypothetical protein